MSVGALVVEFRPSARSVKVVVGGNSERPTIRLGRSRDSEAKVASHGVMKEFSCFYCILPVSGFGRQEGWRLG